MDNLDPNSADRLVSAAKGVVGVCPFIGPLASEAIGALIPNQRLDRVVEFLRQLDKNVQKFEDSLDKFEENMKSQEGLAILEEGLVQAAHSVSIKRTKRLANLIAHSLTKEEVKYAESRKLLNLFDALTDPEVLWLIYYSLNPVIGPGAHRDLMKKHPDILKPVSRDLRATQEQRDRAALQDSYKNTLQRYNLIKQKSKTKSITTLGRLLVRYVENHEVGTDEN